MLHYTPMTLTKVRIKHSVLVERISLGFIFRLSFVLAK